MSDPASAASLPGLQEQLAQVIARHVPITIMAEVVTTLGFDDNFLQRRKEAPKEPALAKLHLARLAVVAAAQKSGGTELLARALVRRLWLDSEAVGTLFPYTEGDPGDDAAKQAAIALRANTLRMAELRERLTDWEPWLCVIVAELPEGTRRGTGFLVGPDTVLTAFHTLKDHVVKVEGAGPQGEDELRVRQPAPGALHALFDHVQGGPIRQLADAGRGILCVPFAQEWLLAACEDLARDGLDPDPDPPTSGELALRQARLDFVLVRLAEPVGAQARNATIGGPRRRWMQLQAVVTPLTDQDRIIIPQHPEGHPQRIDFGRVSGPFTQRDGSNTRIRYDTETSPGTSGAPCFNQNFQLVGLHNAELRRAGQTEANQAIRLERIIAHLQAHPLGARVLQAAPPPPGSMTWSASPDPDKPRVVIGRRQFSAWIAAAAAEAPLVRAERIYAAEGKDRGTRNTSGFGKSFSIEILKAARRGMAEHIVVLGTNEALLPATATATAPDLLLAIAVQLQIPDEEMKMMPPRPGTPAASSDKLSRWASEELPAWFDGVLARRRQLTRDLAAEAAVSVRLMTQLGLAVPPELQNIAAGVSVTESRWRHVWIALDRLGETRLPEEVCALLGGLTGGSLPEPSVRPELRRLRWLFLGFRPDFLAEDSVTTELLDPMQITVADCIVPLQEMAAALGRVLSNDYLKGLSDAMTLMLAPGPPFDDANRRLWLLQGRLVGFTQRVERSVRQSQPGVAGVGAGA